MAVWTANSWPPWLILAEGAGRRNVKKLSKEVMRQRLAQESIQAA